MSNDTGVVVESQVGGGEGGDDFVVSVCRQLARSPLLESYARGWAWKLIHSRYCNESKERVLLAWNAAMSAVGEGRRGEQVALRKWRVAEDLVDEALSGLGVRLRFNTRRGGLELDVGGDWEPVTGALEKSLYWRVRRLVRRGVSLSADGGVVLGKFVEIKRGEWLDSLDALGWARQVDPFVEWLEGLPAWDGKRRVDGLLSELYMVDGDIGLAEFAARSVLVGAVRRAYEPGAKHDLMVVLTGGQGIGKSTLLRELLPWRELFTDALDWGSDDKVKCEALRGAVLVESSELQGLSRAEFAAVKQFLSRQVDRYRPPYERQVAEFPRACVIVGTSNDPTPLPNDASGSRRFLPVSLELRDGVDAVEMPDYIAQWMSTWREQLWAEALALYRKGAKTHMGADLARRQAAANAFRRSVDEVLEDELDEWLAGRGYAFTLRDVLVGLEVERPTRRQQLDVTAALRARGYVPRRVRRDGRKVMEWYGGDIAAPSGDDDVVGEGT